MANVGIDEGYGVKDLTVAPAPMGVTINPSKSAGGLTPLAGQHVDPVTGMIVSNYTPGTGSALTAGLFLASAVTAGLALPAVIGAAPAIAASVGGGAAKVAAGDVTLGDIGKAVGKVLSSKPILTGATIATIAPVVQNVIKSVAGGGRSTTGLLNNDNYIDTTVSLPPINMAGGSTTVLKPLGVGDIISPTGGGAPSAGSSTPVNNLPVFSGSPTTPSGGNTMPDITSTLGAVAAAVTGSSGSGSVPATSYTAMGQLLTPKRWLIASTMPAPLAQLFVMRKRLSPQTVVMLGGGMNEVLAFMLMNKRRRSYRRRFTGRRYYRRPFRRY